MSVYGRDRAHDGQEDPRTHNRGVPAAGGAFALVLHSHLPYVRGAGRWPHGEEWIHEAILGTYLPLLVLLHDLRDAGVGYRLTLGLTPILLEQLADADVTFRFAEYADGQIARAGEDLRRFAAQGDTQRASLALFHRSLVTTLRDAHARRFGRDLVGGFADLARTSHVELLTSAATHGYLPLLDARSVRAQLAVGLRTTRRLTGIEPRGVWLPECAYAPGLEDVLESLGLTHFFTDAALLGPRRADERTARARRSGGAIDVPLADAADVLHPFRVGASSVAAFARHHHVSGQVWSAALGYPGDPAYREFHKKDDRSGLRYWRVTDASGDLGAKALYAPGAAAERARAHAGHFVALVRETMAAHGSHADAPVLTVTFDAELFGHWWFEGIDWLGGVMRELSSAGPRPVTPAEHLAAHPPLERALLREGSWGTANDHSTWRNEGTAWLWDELARLAGDMAALSVVAHSGPLRQRAARQAVRELLLAQASDWPFLITTRQAPDYAAERFRTHALRFRRALDLALHGADEDEPELGELERADGPFPDAGPRDVREE